MYSIAKFPLLSVMLLNLLASHTAIGQQSTEQVAFSDVAALTRHAPDQILSYGSHDAQFIEFWQPQDSVAPVPVIVLVHGGCWLNAFGVDHTRAAAMALVTQGFAVGAIEYRRLGDQGGGWPGSRNDIVAAIDYLTDSSRHAQQGLNIDNEKLFVAGHSAGGYLALHAVEQTRVRPALTIGLAAITDIIAYSNDNGSCQRAAAEFTATAEAEGSDALAVAADSELPRILFYAQADRIVEPAQTRLGSTPVVKVAKAGHFDFIHPRTPAWNSWVEHIKDTLRQ